MSNVSVLKRYNLVETMEDRTTRCLALTQSLIYFLGVLGILIPTGIFLFNKERDNQCAAPNDWEDLNNFNEYDDVDYRFSVVLKLFFTVFLVDAVRYLLLIAGILLRSKALMLAWVLFIPNDLLSLASMIVLHTWRFRLSGQLCSCVNSRPLCDQEFVTDQQRPFLLIRRGRMLLGIAIWWWFFFVFNLIMWALIAAAARKFRNRRA